jgi:pimeloyl-ACP methyl ester carboxylesterase
MKQLYIVIAAVLCCFHLLQANAEEVVLSFKHTPLKGVAEYSKGDANKPVVLILHGFLTNNQFHTITAMSDALQLEGYSTLAPNLTLGMNLRRNALSCTSIHTHTLQQDLQEVDQWVQWLSQKGHDRVILLGHSSGSQQLIEYVVKYPHPTIKQMLLTSTFYLNGTELGTQKRDLEYATKEINNGSSRPHPYSFLFCNNNYHATPESFMSYQTITRQRLLSTLSSIDIPTYTIMGGDDERYTKVGKNWLNELKATGTKLTIVEKANHFFALDGEPKLQEALIHVLTSIGD